MSKVFFIHRRRVLNNAIQSNGGATIAFRETDAGIKFAFAECSIKDNFSRAVGRAKAAGRLNSPTHVHTTGWNFDEFNKYMSGIPVQLCSYRKGGLFQTKWED